MSILAFPKALCWLVIAAVSTTSVLGQFLSLPKGIVKPLVSTLSNNLLDPQSNKTILSEYIDLVHGISLVDLVHKALTLNSELAAARLEIERARARLRQAGILPNPTLSLERTNGIFNSPGERNVSIELTVPLEINGQRQRRVELARIEFEAAKAEVADRERQLTIQVHNSYVEVLSALRELEIISEINMLDEQTVQNIEVRIMEGDAAPLEANLLRTEIDRLRSRAVLVEGRLKAALFQLKSLVSIPVNEVLRLKETLVAPILPEPPATLEVALEIALRTRADLRLARLTEDVARAGLRLVRAQARPDATAFTKYSVTQSTFDSTPVGSITDHDKLLTVGISITLPIFNRNQGTKAEAEIAITQAKHRREFLEQIIKVEISSAYARYEAAQTALSIFKSGVIERSTQNLQMLRGAYDVGAIHITEVIAEQRRFTDSQREYNEALAERYRALAALQTAIGITTP